MSKSLIDVSWNGCQLYESIQSNLASLHWYSSRRLRRALTDEILKAFQNLLVLLEGLMNRIERLKEENTNLRNRIREKNG